MSFSRVKPCPKSKGASPDAGLSLGFCSPFQHCGGKYSVHTPSWRGLITLSSPSHEQHIENASNSSKDNREICWELNTPACLSRSQLPRSCHIQQTTQSANSLQNCTSRYSPDSLTALQRLLSSREGAGKPKANWGKHEKPTGLGKGKLGEKSSYLRWWTGKAREGTAVRELAGVPNDTVQTHTDTLALHQVAGGLIHSVGRIGTCWESLIAL